MRVASSSWSHRATTSSAIEQENGKRDCRKSDNADDGEQLDQDDRDRDEHHNELRRGCDPGNRADDRSRMFARPPDVRQS